MYPLHEHRLLLTRRELFGRSAVGIGTAALATLLGEYLGAAPAQPAAVGALPGLPHFAPKAKRVIYLMQAGAPSHVDLFDDKPELARRRGQELPPRGYQQSQAARRDHHPRCFTIRMAGGGIKGGTTYGETDDFAHNVARNGVHVHDWQATVLHCLGIDHARLTFRYQGRYFRLTDVHGRVVREVLA